MKRLGLFICVSIVSFQIVCSKNPRKEKEVTSNNSEEQTASHVSNINPQYTAKNLVELRELHSIPFIGSLEYTISDIHSMGADSASNLFILDAYQSKIYKFDKRGRFIKKFGGDGFGQNEFTKPRRITIYKDKLFVMERNRGLKITDLNGQYIDFIPFKTPSSPMLTLKTFNNFHVALIFTFNPENMNERIWSLVNFDYSFDNYIEIAKFKIKQNAFNIVSRTLINAVDSENNYYFPNDDESYIINKYDVHGNLLLSFGRQYHRKKYSTELKNWLQSNNKNTTDMPVYPPIIRSIFIDDNDRIWVVVGECFFDSNNKLLYQSTVDIFNNNGKFLYSFTSDKFSQLSFINSNRLYSGPNSLEDDKIKVFDIIAAF